MNIVYGIITSGTIITGIFVSNSLPLPIYYVFSGVTFIYSNYFIYRHGGLKLKIKNIIGNMLLSTAASITWPINLPLFAYIDHQQNTKLLIN